MAAAAGGPALQCQPLQPHLPQVRIHVHAAFRQGCRLRRWRPARSSGAEQPAVAVDGAEAAAGVPAGRTQVTLRIPVGIVFAQNKGGPVFVEQLVEGGNAAKSGAVAVGDVLARCSAIVLKEGKEGQYEKEGYGQRLYTNWERTTFNCEGQEFKTVMSALKSNNPRWGVLDCTLEFRKP